MRFAVLLLAAMLVAVPLALAGATRSETRPYATSVWVVGLAQQTAGILTQSDSCSVVTVGGACFQIIEVETRVAFEIHDEATPVVAASAVLVDDQRTGPSSVVCGTGGMPTYGYTRVYVYLLDTPEAALVCGATTTGTNGVIVSTFD